MYVDPTGNIFITISLLAAMGVAAVVGAGLGIAGTFLSDVINWLVTGEWAWSAWEEYLGNAIGGAFGGMLSLFTFAGPYIGAVVAGTFGTFFGLSIGKYTGSNNKSWTEILEETGISLGISLLTAGLTKYAKLPGITKGSHSWQQVFNSGFSKTIKYGYNMSIKTLAKGGGYLLVSGISVGYLTDSIFKGFIRSQF